MNIINELKKLLTSNKIFIVLSALLGIGILMVISSEHFNTGSPPTEPTAKVNNKAENGTTTNEQELEKILSEIKGVGDVKIMIAYGSTDKKIIEKDKDSNGNEKTVTKNESSKSEPYVIMTESPTINGIIVVAKGGGNIHVKNMIIDCVSDVMGVSAYKVKVLEMK